MWDLLRALHQNGFTWLLPCHVYQMLPQVVIEIFVHAPYDQVSIFYAISNGLSFLIAGTESQSLVLFVVGA